MSGGQTTVAASSEEELLDQIQKQSFAYFPGESNAENGLVADRTEPGSPASTAVVGLGLTAYAVAVERGWIAREEAAARVLTTLRFLEKSPQGTEPDATGYRGFYYHFLDCRTGRRAPGSELSTIDTAFLIAGALAAARYFDRETAAEAEIRRASAYLYERIDWRWAADRGATLSHGWTPEEGFLPYRWTGYCEALLLYALALGSPTHAIAEESYHAWVATYEWKEIYGREVLYAGPLFIHQFSHLWIDFRGIRDAPMRERRLDYFENSRRATQIQREYATRNPMGFVHYGSDCWGLTASDGPGPATILVDGVERVFFGYCARGAPFGPDDGTVSPWAAVASLPFAPEIVLPAIRYFVDEIGMKDRHEYGFEASFNATYPEKSESEFGWVSPWVFGLNQGPIVLAIENYRSGLPWRLMRTCAPIVRGLERAGFRGGWLD